MNYVLILVGFVLLIKGADYFVDGASAIAKTFKIPTLVIGLTIVAFGTSAPEAAVSITSAIQGQNAIAMGNVVGSNIFNLLMVVGVSAFICPFSVKKSILLKEFPFVLLSGIVLLVISFDTALQGSAQNILTRGDGIILLLFFGIFMYYLIAMAITSKDDDCEDIEEMPLKKSILLSIIGIIGIVFGGKIVVDSASAIAIQWGMSETLVGLTIVAIGTSLPELVTSVVAAKKNQSDIALGNVIGSNMFNAFFILGISATIHPIEIGASVITDLVVLLIVTLITYAFAISKKKVNKMEGATLVIIYIIYMAYIIMRN